MSLIFSTVPLLSTVYHLYPPHALQAQFSPQESAGSAATYIHHIHLYPPCLTIIFEKHNSHLKSLLILPHHLQLILYVHELDLQLEED